MIQIRKGVFETNSSSSHSIVFLKEPDKKEIEPTYRMNEDGIMDFWYEDDLQFGRSPFELLTDWDGRLRYAIASYSMKDDKIHELEEICKKKVPGFKCFKFKKDKWDNQEYRGYVDHQSVGLLDAALAKYNVSLEDFVFDDKFIVVIDGDEYCIFNTLIETPMFNDDAVEDITSACFAYEEDFWKKEKEK